MTEEDPIKDVAQYQFPDQYLRKLEEYDTNSPHYSIVQGQLYETLRTDARFDATEALDVSRMLNNGELEKVEDFIYERLE